MQAQVRPGEGLVKASSGLGGADGSDKRPVSHPGQLNQQVDWGKSHSEQAGGGAGLMQTGSLPLVHCEEGAGVAPTLPGLPLASKVPDRSNLANLGPLRWNV